MAWRRTLVLTALAAACLADVSAAAMLRVTGIDRSLPGVVRIAVDWSGGRTPSFRLSPTCGVVDAGDWVLASTVITTPARRHAVLELADDLAWLGDRRLPCQARGLTVQMLEGSRVVASADVPIEIPAPRALTAAPPPPTDPLAPRLGFVGHKLQAPQTKMSEAGVTWSVNNRVTLNLSYERTGYAPMMPHDHDDGVLTGVKVGF